MIIKILKTKDSRMLEGSYKTPFNRKNGEWGDTLDCLHFCISVFLVKKTLILLEVGYGRDLKEKRSYLVPCIKTRIDG